ncbi:acyltransferase family protein [Microbacterium sp. A93]|uniref:acyltransferase family protein n=1 Tax=Microbacterium sp. A93 TaxID=3450716 RepID=UPI003F438444
MSHQSKRHVLFLDLVRGVAAQAVLVGHAVVIAFPALIGHKNFFYVQSWAVVVFLALSGYLIAGSVKRRLAAGTFTLAGYTKDRFARIFVPLVPLVPIVLIGDRVFLGNPPKTPLINNLNDGPLAIVTNLLMLQDNWVIQGVDRVLGTDLSRRSLGSAAPWWTVGLEWWIYLAFGCLLALILAKTKYRFASVLVGLFALASVIGTTLSGNMLIGAWIVGAALAWWAPQLSSRAWTAIAAVSTAAVIGFLVLEPGSVYRFPVVAGTSVAILAAYRASDWSVLTPAARPIKFVANYSYSLYLIHFPLLIWTAAAAPGLLGIWFVLVSFIGANIVAVLCWAAFEQQFPKVRTWMDRFPAPRGTKAIELR